VINCRRRTTIICCTAVRPIRSPKTVVGLNATTQSSPINRWYLPCVRHPRRLFAYLSWLDQFSGPRTTQSHNTNRIVPPSLLLFAHTTQLHTAGNNVLWPGLSMGQRSSRKLWSVALRCRFLHKTEAVCRDIIAALLKLCTWLLIHVIPNKC